MRVLCMLLLMTGLVRAEGENAGEFDYYILSLSWSPNWCDIEGDDRRSPQCDAGTGFGWVLHGLWPQYETGWPSYCRTAERNPSRAETAAQSGLYGSSGSAWHQWNKHGRCSGLSSRSYYEVSREAYDSIQRPEILRKLTRSVKLPAAVVEEAFLEANPDLKPDQITITCKKDRIQEVRVCLTRSLTPRVCGQDVIRDCTMDDALLAPIRR